VTTHEVELKALMPASLDGDTDSHRALPDRLSSRLTTRASSPGWGGAQRRLKIWFKRRLEAHMTRFEKMMEPDHDEKTSHDFTLVAANGGVGVCICRFNDNRQELLAE
jgi:hypothetical protein